MSLIFGNFNRAIFLWVCGKHCISGKCKVLKVTTFLFHVEFCNVICALLLSLFDWGTSKLFLFLIRILFYPLLISPNTNADHCDDNDINGFRQINKLLLLINCYRSWKVVFVLEKNSRFSHDVTEAMLVCRTIGEKVFWDLDSIIMQNLSDILPLFCTPAST